MTDVKNTQELQQEASRQDEAAAKQSAATDQPQKPAKSSSQGKRIVIARRITLSAVFVAVIISLAFDTGLGTPSSFGIGQFFLLCPLAGLEAMVAAGSLIPVSLISLAVVLVFILLFGRAWCAWGCPAPVIRRFFKREPKPQLDSGRSEAMGAGCSAAAEVRGFAAALKHIGRDARTWTLVAVIVATLIAGLPLFCLVCPIGLTFGTVGSLWHLIVDKQVTMSCLVFPTALLIELVLYRRWCLNLCPIAGLLNIFGQAARLFRPRVQAESCLRCSGEHSCTVCQAVCPEHINLHAPDAALQLAECSRCGECVKHCPSASISIKAAPSEPVLR